MINTTTIVLINIILKNCPQVSSLLWDSSGGSECGIEISYWLWNSRLTFDRCAAGTMPAAGC